MVNRNYKDVRSLCKMWSFNDVKDINLSLLLLVALCLAGGVIIYISSVNVEVSHRKQLGLRGSNSFHYQYGWAFFFAGSTFVANMMSAVANITVYLSKYSQIDNVALIEESRDGPGEDDTKT